MKIISDRTPKESIGEKWNKLPKTTKIAVYCCAGAAVACVVSAFLFMFIRQRRNGRKERDAYNQLIEKQQQENQEQMELRDKGTGAWDSSSSTQGDDTQGGWGGAHSPHDDTSYVGPNGSASSAMIQGGKGPKNPTLVETASLSSPMSAEFNVPQQPRFGSSSNGGSYSNI